ncbi:EGF domain-specific O-linked N-acetylglucosamine transferase-like [Haliotis asinina]|uniref:EGF domain-specific O-linked N-acetylglucosamine transferase-like n=1 Tax=Haliotis asinina TaxID=109174 RepID=UPI0035321AA0
MLGLWLWPHLLTLVATAEGATDWGDLRLPLEHVPYFFRNNPHLEQRCKDEDTCPYKAMLRETRCWGYEEKCPESQRKSLPQCEGEVEPTRRKSVPDRKSLFWRQADFGYVKDRMDNMKVFCRGSHTSDSSLECTDALGFCRGRNIYLDLRHANMTTRDRYRNDIVHNSTFGGHCDLDKVGLNAAMTTPVINKRPLASWMQEMEHFASLHPQPLSTGECDVIVDRPTLIIKMDEEYNIFHHTCVFMNLYISLHLNNSFSKHVNLLVWDTSAFDLLGYMSELRGAFTKHDVMLLKQLDGKRVCFRDAIFSLPSRMLLGIYYNLAPPEKLRVTFLVRNQYLSQTSCSYRCGIDNMYPDLARMRGINYITWEKMDALTPENKTALPNRTNYSFDVGEFVRLVRVAADQVTSHHDLKKARLRTHKGHREL